jgi:hypothetical protein
MSHLSSAHHEQANKIIHTNKIDNGRTTETFLNSNSNHGNTITHHIQAKVLTTWFLSYIHKLSPLLDVVRQLPRDGLMSADIHLPPHLATPATGGDNVDVSGAELS